MTTDPMPRLPNPLTPDSLRNLMRERPYWDLKHPRSPLYRRLVEKGFGILYPGAAEYDGIGRMIDPDPLPPHQVAPLVAEINREMDELERMSEGAASGGAVHVQSHTRDGGKTEVADYWRSRPDEGGGADSGDDLPKPRNLLDDAENASAENEAGGTQAGTDNNRPKPANPLPDLPKIEIRRDDAGDGRFGSSRERPDGTKYDHEGVDIKAPPGTPVTSPVDGKIDRISPRTRTRSSRASKPLSSRATTGGNTNFST